MRMFSLSALGIVLAASSLPSQAMDPVGQQYVNQMLQGGPSSVRQAAQGIYNTRMRDREVLDVAAQLLSERGPSASDNSTADAMAWLCKALGQSGDGRYKALLSQLGENGPNRKLKSHCGRAANSLQASAESFRAGSINLQTYRNNANQAATHSAPSAPAARTGNPLIDAHNAAHGYTQAAPGTGSGTFNQVRSGMSVGEVNALIGPPTDTYSHITGKAFNPFNFTGKDSSRIVHLYKGRGRIVFSLSNAYAGTWRAIEVIADANEVGYR